MLLMKAPLEDMVKVEQFASRDFGCVLKRRSGWKLSDLK